MTLFHSLSLKTSFSKLKSSSQGLSKTEARHRLKKYGANKLPATKSLGRLFIFISQFKNPLILLLLVAGIISLIISQYLDAEIVFGAILINVIIGFFQENKANNALKQLKKLVEYKTIVRREGINQKINSSEIVIGDIIILRAGEQITVDARVISSVDLQINEASLTGEANPIYKNNLDLPPNTVLAERKNMVYSGTVVMGGSGEVLVVAKGQETELGKISKLIHEIPETKTPLQKRLVQLSRFISLIAVVISLLIIILGLIQGRDFFDIFLTAVAVAVAAVPEGLVVAVTVILTLGMKQILRKKALTRKLLAVETLGSITTICTDKTGTLTEGIMQVAHIIIATKKLSFSTILHRKNKSEMTNFIRALTAGLLCNNAIIEATSDGHSLKSSGSSIEVALLRVGQELGIDQKQLFNEQKKIAELPFSSERKYMITLHSLDNNYVLYEKGAPEKIIAKSSKFLNSDGLQNLTDKEKVKLLQQVEELSSQGLRLIALATRKINKLPWELQQESKDWNKIDNNLIFMGLISFKDPLRPEARETIALCRRAGIRPMIITGDHPLTAFAIAQEVGFSDQLKEVVSGQELDNVNEQNLRIIVKTHNIYARVSPEHKLRIVRALRANGEVVAMTGDGLNDSLALKTADIGVCLGSGTDVAKETADIILLDNNFKVIVAAIREGRIIFSNIRKSISYLISDSFSEMFLIIGSIFFGLPLAILPAQILWVNIINDGLPNFSLAFERSDKNVMDLAPLKRSEAIVNKEMKTIILGLGLTRDLGILILFIYLYKHQLIWGWDINYLRTFFFALLGFKSISGIFSLRSLSVPIYKIRHLQNPYLLGAFFTSLLLLILAIYWGPLQKFIGTVPLGLTAWIFISIIALINILIIEIIKYSFHRKANYFTKLNS